MQITCLKTVVLLETAISVCMIYREPEERKLRLSTFELRTAKSPVLVAI
jgi:hypothetical protein